MTITKKEEENTRKYDSKAGKYEEIRGKYEENTRKCEEMQGKTWKIRAGSVPAFPGEAPGGLQDPRQTK